MSRGETHTEVGATLIRESDAAILIEAQGEEMWIPTSQIEEITRYPNGTVDVVMQRWIASKKGLL